MSERSFRIIEKALADIGHGGSGGSTTFKDMAFFERIKPSQPVIWHNTRWFESDQFPNEEIKIITMFLCRKKIIK